MMRFLRMAVFVALGITLFALSPLLLGSSAQAQDPETCFGLQASASSGSFRDDVIIGTAQPEQIYGRGGNDAICGRAGGDHFRGGGGDDRIDGEEGNDTLEGNGGNDIIMDGSGTDNISGGGGRDTIYAADGEVDTINCGLGYDLVEADEVDIISRNCEDVRYQ